MQTYIGQSKNPNSSLMTQIAAQIVAINEIANLTDGNLTGLQKFINAPELGFNVSPKIKGSSLVYFSSTSTQDLNMLATSLNQTSLDGNGNGFYQLLLNIMAGEYQNALSTPPSSCTSPATGYCNWLNCRTPNMCVDGTCCAKSCVGNTCCSIDINKNPLGLPSPDGICP
jgi:hypothetical protein